MSFNFVIPVINIGGTGNEVPTLQFYKKGFNLNYSGVTPSWQDIILSGNTALTLTNALANGLNYLKLFGGTEQLPETYLDTVTLSGGCEQRNLPSGYTQVEYLESSGTQWIDTGYKLSSADEVKVKAKFVKFSSSGSSYIFGIYGDNANFGINGNSTASYAVWGSSSTEFTPTMVTGTVYNIDVKLGLLTINGVTASYTPSGTFTNITKNAYLFWANGTAQSKYPVAIYLFQVINNGIIVQNLIPCRRNSDSVLGMYDTVTNTFLPNAGTGTFTAGADVTTPSPDTPIDIVCNNGVVKARHQSGLPLGYTLLDYIESTGTQYIDTGIVPANKKIGAVIDFQCTSTTSAAAGVFGSNSQDSVNNIQITVLNSKWRYKINNFAAYGSTYDTNRHTVSLNMADGTKLDGNVVTSTQYAINSTNTQNCFLGACNYNGSVETDVNTYTLVGKIYSAKVYDDGTLVRNLIPARRNSDSVLGMYDTVTGTFFTNAGTGTFTAGSDVDDMEIYTDGVQEQVTDSLGNTANAERLLAVGDYKDTQEVLIGAITRNIGIKVLDGTEDWQSLTGYMSILKTDLGTDSIVLPRNSTDIFCTHFQAKTGTFVDGIGSGGSYINFKYDSLFTTLAQWQQYLATQYANGTPVIVVYPLATSTTETVTSQFLSKSPVTQTAGSISNLPIAITESAHTTPTPTQPLDIRCNNGVVKVSKNLFDKNNESLLFNNRSLATSKDGYWYYANGSTSLACACEGNKTYTISGISESTSIFRVATIDVTNLPDNTDETMILYSSINRMTSAQVYTFTTPSTAKWIIVQTSAAAFNDTVETIQIEQGNTATTYHPYVAGGIYTDGTQETVTVTGKNLFDRATVTKGYYISVTGEIVANETTMYSDYIKVRPSTTYTISLISGSSGNSIRVHSYTTNKTWIEQLSEVLTGAVGSSYSATFTTSSNAKYIRVSCRQAQQDIQLELGSTATTYEPYFNGGTATAEMLLKIGTYQDVQSVIDGGVTRNIGVKVLDGTEDWTLSTATGSNSVFYISQQNMNYNSDVACFCTHYKGELPSVSASDQTDKTAKAGYSGSMSGRERLYIKDTSFSTDESFQQYLADQYNAGTPVIIVYPLATATTETVTGQSLTTQAGTNIVEITQASIDNLGLEVSYKATV